MTSAPSAGALRSLVKPKCVMKTAAFFNPSRFAALTIAR